MKKYGLVPLSCYYGSVFLPLLSLPSCAALLRAHTASCQTLTGQEVSLVLLKMKKAGATCG